MSWKLDDWESTIEKILAEMNQAAQLGGKRRIVDTWRSRLENEPAYSQPYQIDMIMREVQRRLKGDDK
jgi:hypothetical protein